MQPITCRAALNCIRPPCGADAEATSCAGTAHLRTEPPALHQARERTAAADAEAEQGVISEMPAGGTPGACPLRAPASTLPRPSPRRASPASSDRASPTVARDVQPNVTRAFVLSPPPRLPLPRTLSAGRRRSLWGLGVHLQMGSS